MITIKKNSGNIIVVTLTEKSTLTSPVYIFEFINDVTGYSTVFTAVDASTNTTRYNQFNVTEDILSNQDLLTGVIYLKDLGSYTYNIYETTLSSPQSLVLTGLNKVETGKMTCVDNTIVTTREFNIDDVIDNNQYEAN